ncbi:hypothetical protein SORBI_3010G008433 [Sorghum bicolor]|uniref:Uncharacterized protein n=1 Tax=Sorghum bicolor TaxID=4558 RepID=A0A1W0VQZ5_SORBI|nr:hypothetical protein SORBI_3010G008433 [Sorghum bicolor]
MNALSNPTPPPPPPPSPPAGRARRLRCHDLLLRRRRSLRLRAPSSSPSPGAPQALRGARRPRHAPCCPRAARWEGGSEAKPFVATALANMQHVLQEFKCCCPAKARRVFDRMPARDRVAWNKRNRLSSSAMETVSRLPDAAGGREQGRH